jgi:hypothetical protein
MERNQESFIVVMGVIAISSMAILQQTQQVQARPLFAGPGYDDGYAEGKDDFLIGNPREYDCSPNNSDEYCDDYRDGYGDGWEKQEDLGRHQGGYERDDN